MNGRSLLERGREGTLDMVLTMRYNSTMSTEKEVKINTRYPVDVYAAIKQLAQQDSRSFNNMVIWILREYIKQRQGK